MSATCPTLSPLAATPPLPLRSSFAPLRLCAHLLPACTLLFAAGPLFAQAGAQVPDPDPEIERRSFQVADGFEVNLFAADPLLAKPIQMNFDPAGRLWVACSEVYPQIKPGQKANDKIIILEDTKGTGRADRTTVFADGLLIPTGIEPGDGGVYVGSSTELLHLADTHGKGRADRTRVVLSGFGTEDTHHIVHTLRWGPDGMLYFNQSVYIHSHLETPHGVRRLNGGGIWQLRPETMQLEVFVRGFWNSWGHHFDRWGQSFITDGANGEGINYGVTGASYAATPGATRILQGLNPGSPKHCGLEILSGRHLPEAWRGNMITNDFRGHRVCRFVVREEGSGYVSQEKAELIKTNHSAFRPVDVKMGPDGAIYIADWYNPIIQHGEVDFRDPRRDHTHGRIWRVTARGRPLVKRPQLVNASTAALLDALREPEDWTRHHAKRVLKERGPKVLPELATWVRNLKPTDLGHEHDLLEALWTYQSLDVVEPSLLNTLLHARDHHARAAAVRVIQHWHGRLANPLELLAARVVDDEPQVRLEAVRALGQIPSPRAAEIALRALDRPVDKFLDYGIWLTTRELEPYWMPALQQGQLDFGGNVRHLVFALQAVGSRSSIQPLLQLVKTGKVTGEREEGVLVLIAAVGGPPELRLVFDRLLAREGSRSSRQAHLLLALEQATRQRGVRPAGDLSRLGELLGAESDTLRASTLRVAGLWKQEALRPRILDFARTARTSEELRRAAIEALVSLGGPASREALEQLSAAEQPIAIRQLAVIALAGIDLEAAAQRAVEVLAASPALPPPSDVFNAFLERKSGAATLTTALAEKKLPTDVAKLGVRSVRASGRNAPALIEALTKAGGLTAVRRTLTPREMEALVADVARLGDPARGEAVYRRTDQACVRCHAIAGAGGQVGPDLASIGASAPIDYLIDSILLPNKAVKENYHSMVVTTIDGRIFTGIKVRETKTELILRSADDREVAVPIKSIEEKAVGGSLMPEGLADTLTRTELLDLVRFLSELGKVGPYSVSKARLVRRWQVLEATPEARQLLQRTRLASAATNDPVLLWSPAYSQVSGTLPLDAIPRHGLSKEARVGFVRCQLDVSTGGKVKLLLDSAAGLTAWIDGVPLEAGEQLLCDLQPGVHTLTFALDLVQRHDGLRCELADLPDSPARAHLIGGK